MDVRPSDIAGLKERVSRQSYKQYIREMHLSSVRSFQSQKIAFDFPVTAIIGTNGGGKSTILGAAAIAYKGPPKPADFFPKSNVSDEAMAGWRIDYDLIERAKQKVGMFKCNSRFVSAKWRRDAQIVREIVYLPILRTVPASEQSRYWKFIGMQRNPNAIIESLSQSVASAAGRILGKDLSNFKVARASKEDSDFILVGATRDNKGYSQFHFGAGEASIITMIIKIESASDNALILIEEVENGLHPIATRKMVEYLIDVAKRKKQQVIFTTHSEASLEPLPPEAIWACIDGTAYQGRLSIQSLRAMTGRIDRKCVIFVEDRFAKDWVEDIMKQYLSEKLESTEVHAAGGYPYIISVVKHHNDNVTIKTKAKAVLDGDIENDSESQIVAKLPGQIPELEIFDYISDNIDRLASKVQQRCMCPSLSQQFIADQIKQTRIDTTDMHLLFSKLGELLLFTSEVVVRKAFISIYDEENRTTLEPLISFLKAD